MAGSDRIVHVQLLKKSGNTCPLPYPERFKAAVKLVKDREAAGMVVPAVQSVVPWTQANL